ncbi:MAG: NAD-dependent epimerase/dehydratase family protein [Leptolyngbya sp.]|nr:NAD-dependent epimerase/dehydratase family protein [Candidatus Melainabacteria bacterium]
MLAGVDGVSSVKQVIENNLYGTVNMLEYARRRKAGFILLSTSRVYSIAELQKIPLLTSDHAFLVDDKKNSVPHVSSAGIREAFSTAAPISIYGSTKLCSEVLALEYAETYQLPVWINRCGVLAGAGQFGRPDQGIFAYWINAFRSKQPLRYIGFGGTGHQYRDCLHPRDLASLVEKQMESGDAKKDRLINVGGGAENAMSLRQLSNWCEARYGALEIASVKEDRQLDVPWVVMDSGLAKSNWDFKASVSMTEILIEIADHADKNPDWLKISAV